MVVLETMTPSIAFSVTSAAISSSSASTRSGAIFRKMAGCAAAAARAAMTRDKQLAKLFTRLHVAQARRVRRGDVDGQIAGVGRKPGNAAFIVSDAVGAVLVGADIDADDAGAALAGGKPLFGGRVALIVEAQPVDHRFVRCQPEDARLRVAGLRQRRDRADLGKAEAEAKQRIGNLGVLVVAGGHAERIGEIDAADADFQPVVAHGPPGDRQPAFQRRDRQAVGGFRIECEQEPLAEPVEHAHSASSVGNDVAIGAERQWLHPDDGVEVERAVEMREQRTAARDLVFQRVAEFGAIDGDQQQPGLAGKVFGRRFPAPGRRWKNG